MSNNTGAGSGAANKKGGKDAPQLSKTTSLITTPSANAPIHPASTSAQSSSGFAPPSSTVYTTGSRQPTSRTDVAGNRGSYGTNPTLQQGYEQWSGSTALHMSRPSHRATSPPPQPSADGPYKERSLLRMGSVLPESKVDQDFEASRNAKAKSPLNKAKAALGRLDISDKISGNKERSGPCYVVIEYIHPEVKVTTLRASVDRFDGTVMHLDWDNKKNSSALNVAWMGRVKIAKVEFPTKEQAKRAITVLKYGSGLLGKVGAEMHDIRTHLSFDE